MITYFPKNEGIVWDFVNALLSIFTVLLIIILGLWIINKFIALPGVFGASETTTTATTVK